MSDHGSVRPPGWIGGECHRALQEDGHRRQAATGLRLAR